MELRINRVRINRSRPVFWPFFPKTAWKWKRNRPEEESPRHPLWSANDRDDTVSLAWDEIHRDEHLAGRNELGMLSIPGMKCHQCSAWNSDIFKINFMKTNKTYRDSAGIMFRLSSSRMGHVPNMRCYFCYPGWATCKRWRKINLTIESTPSLRV